MDYLKLTGPQMGFVTSAIGFWRGARPVRVAHALRSHRTAQRDARLLVIAAIFLYLFIQTGANLPMLFGLLFFAAMFNFGALAILAGPIPAEAAPVGLIASVAGIVTAPEKSSAAASHPRSRAGSRITTAFSTRCGSRCAASWPGLGSACSCARPLPARR